MDEPLTSIEHEADCLIKQEDYSSALLLYDGICAEKPPHATPYMIAGALSIKCNNYQKALGYLTRALQIDPNHAPTLYHLGDLYTLSNEYAKATEFLKQAIEKDPDFGPAYVRLGDALLLGGKAASAEKAYMDASSQSHPDASVYLKFGSLHESRQEYKKAIQCYQKYVKVAPHDINGINKLAFVFCKAGRFRKSVELLLHSLKLKPKQPAITFNIGVGYQLLDQTENAIEYYKRTISLSPEYAKAYANLGYLLYECNRKQEAIEYIQKAAKLLPHDSKIQHMVASLGGSNVPSKASSEYVKSTFDDYAHQFEHHLTRALQYRTPQNLHDLFLGISSAQRASLKILDLGCGSGLCGQLFKPYACHLTGVDLSPRMIDEAQKKAVYDELHPIDIFDYLCSTTSHFDIIVAADVLGYIGDLTSLFEGCLPLLKNGGLFLFSAEKADNENKEYILQPSGRYTHSCNYISKLCEIYGFKIICRQEKMMRMQKKQPVIGYHYAVKEA